MRDFHSLGDFDFVDRAEALASSVQGRSPQVSGTVKDQSTFWILPIFQRSTPEVVKRRILPTAVLHEDEQGANTSSALLRTSP